MFWDLKPVSSGMYFYFLNHFYTVKYVLLLYEIWVDHFNCGSVFIQHIYWASSIGPRQRRHEISASLSLYLDENSVGFHICSVRWGGIAFSLTHIDLEMLVKPHTVYLAVSKTQDLRGSLKMKKFAYVQISIFCV